MRHNSHQNLTVPTKLNTILSGVPVLNGIAWSGNLREIGVIREIASAIGHLSYRFSVANFGATMATAPAAGVVVSVSRNAPIVLRPCRRAIAAIGPGGRRLDGAWRQQGLLRLQSQVVAISFGGPALKAASGPRPRR